MNKILILTSQCFKDAKADGICGKNLKSGFNNINRNVYLLGYSKVNKEGMDYLNNNSYCFYHVKNSYKGRVNSIKRLFKPFMDDGLIDKYYKYSEKLIEEKKINILVPVFFPIETLVASLKLKEQYPKLKIILYEVDSSTDVDITNCLSERMKINSYKKFMKKCYKKVDKTLVMNSHLKHVKETFKDDIEGKLSVFDIPVLLKKEKYQVNDNKKTIDFVYGGLLNKDVYSPKPILDFFNLNKDKDEWRLHFYTRGNCEDMIKAASCKDNRIVCHGYVPVEELEEAQKNANFLLSIENLLKPNSIPSKTFNYFALGKPVIHFTYKKGFFCENYIDKYPLGIYILAEEITCKNEKLLKFIEQNKHKIIDTEDIYKVFEMNRPEYSARLIENIASE